MTKAKIEKDTSESILRNFMIDKLEQFEKALKPDIQQKKITFLLGAGASVPFFKKGDKHLTTKLLTEEILNRNKWKNFLVEINDLCMGKEPNFSLTADIIMELFEDIFKFNYKKIPEELAYFLEAQGIKKKRMTPIYEKDFTFEHFLYFLDKICSGLVSRDWSIDNFLLDYWGNDGNVKRVKYCELEGWRILPYLTREFLIKIILEFWQEDGKEAAKELYKNFFDRIIGEYKSVNVYSLNYDPLVYESVKNSKIYCGLDPSLFLKSNNILAFLHGHVGFSFKKSKLQLSENYKEAQENRIKDLLFNKNELDYQKKANKGYHFNTYFLSGLDKIEAYIDNPFSVYMMRFSKDILESDLIVLIGFGFQDNHLNLFLKNKFAYTDDAKIIDVNLKELSDFTFLNKELPRDVLYKKNFFENNFASFRSSVKNFMKTKENVEKARISLWKDKGAAYLTDRMILDFRGVENFFQEVSMKKYMIDLQEKQTDLIKTFKKEVLEISKS